MDGGGGWSLRAEWISVPGRARAGAGGLVSCFFGIMLALGPNFTAFCAKIEIVSANGDLASAKCCITRNKFSFQRHKFGIARYKFGITRSKFGIT
jgi:hypothetical protein